MRIARSPRRSCQTLMVSSPPSVVCWSTAAIMATRRSCSRRMMRRRSFCSAEIVPLRGRALPFYPELKLTPPQFGIGAHLKRFRPDLVHLAGTLPPSPPSARCQLAPLPRGAWGSG